MDVQVLGTGCAKCKKLHAEAEEAARLLGEPVTVEKVEDLQSIMGYGVRQTPALVVDGRVRASGRIPPAKEILEWLRETAGHGNP